ncbi:MAG: cobyrinate a,c-diamide synthase [Lachnospiraceae bacterium]|nr:cobyrinate a,c-diamide synthase [Lachnospiraceae bacterium]
MPRIMIAAPSSGSGKTTIVCGLLQALLDRDRKVHCFKCGPDYIDPMFHRTVLGIPTGNLDSFFVNTRMLRYLLQEKDQECLEEPAISENLEDKRITVLEGVMGYYDGKSVNTIEGSSYDLARKLDTPVLLVVNGKGASLSIVAMIQGFLSYQSPSMIQGILLNQVSASIYQGLKHQIEETLHVPVVGYLPVQQDLVLSGRHLGLVSPDEIGDVHTKIRQLAKRMEETIDVEQIIEIANQTEDISDTVPIEVEGYEGFCRAIKGQREGIRIAIARDSAFCFYYQENIRFLQKAGVTLAPFSPIGDEKLPENIQGLLLGGGYPELHARALSENQSMMRQIRSCLEQGLPCLAECGGYLYLQETLEDDGGDTYPMVGFFTGHGKRAEKRTRFGYIDIRMNGDSILGKAGTSLPGHEFHYWESDQEGDQAVAYKPDNVRSWNCERSKAQTLAGFPHYYFPGNLVALQNFIQCCLDYGLQSL